MKKLDLTGQRFGALIVLSPAENIGGRTAWVCRCDCGQESIVRRDDLRSGHTHSCGCQRSATVKLTRSKLNYVDGTCVEEIRSKKVRRNNTSGVPGVTWINRDQVWRATISFKGKCHYLGDYRKLEDAAKARKRAEEDLHDSFLDEFSRAQPQTING